MSEDTITTRFHWKKQQQIQLVKGVRHICHAGRICNATNVPWPCDGDAQDMVAVMMAGEETPGAKIRRLKTIVLVWHPDKFLSRYSKLLREEDRERIIEGVLDISKEISRCLEREREEEYKSTKKLTS